MIFVLAARHRRTQEVAAWIIERDSLWHAMKNRGDIEAPPTLSPEWIAGCDIALMEPGTIYTGDVWDEIQRANEATALDEELPREGEGADSYAARMEQLERERESFESGDGELISRELLDDEPVDPREARPFGDAITFEENQVQADIDAGEGREDIEDDARDA